MNTVRNGLLQPRSSLRNFVAAGTAPPPRNGLLAYGALVEALLNARGTDEQRKQTAWEKAHVVPGCDPALVRRDDFGLYVYRAEYGNRNSPFGWEIDHIIPIANGGKDVLSNLRALHWSVNASLGGLLSGRGR